MVAPLATRVGASCLAAVLLSATLVAQTSNTDSPAKADDERASATHDLSWMLWPHHDGLQSYGGIGWNDGRPGWSVSQSAWGFESIMRENDDSRLHQWTLEFSNGFHGEYYYDGNLLAMKSTSAELELWAKRLAEYRSHLTAQFEIEVVVTELGAESFRVTRAVTRGERIRIDAASQRRLLTDYEINQTGALPVALPVIGSWPDGTTLELSVVPYPDPTTLRVECVAAKTSLELRRTELGDDWSPIDLPTVDERIVSTSIDVSDNGALHPVATLGDETISVRVRRTTPASEALRDYGAYLSIVDPRSWPASTDLTKTREDERWLHEREFGTPAQRAMSLMLGSDRRLIGGVGERSVTEDAAPQLKARWKAATLAQRNSRTLRFLYVEGPAAEAATVDSHVSPVSLVEAIGNNQALNAREWSVTARAHTLFGVRECKNRSLVRDVETVSGGTGLYVVCESDPVVAGLGAGSEFIGRFEPLADGSVSLQLRSRWCKLHAVASRETKYPVIRDVPGTTQPAGAGQTRKYREIQTMTLQFPEYEERDRVVTLTLTPGQWTRLAFESNGDEFRAWYLRAD